MRRAVSLFRRCPGCLAHWSRSDVVPVNLCQRLAGRRRCCSTPCSHRLQGLRSGECCGTRVKTTLTIAAFVSTTACSPPWSSRGGSSSQVRSFSVLSLVDANLEVAAGTSLAGDVTWPIGWVQLGPYECGGNVSTIRQSQTDALPASEGWFSNHSITRLPIPLSGVAPTYDLCSPMPGHEQTPGNPGYNCWIHARNKSEVARRLALQLLHVAPAKSNQPATAAATSGAGEAAEQYIGPVVKNATLIPASDGHSPRVILTLDHAPGLELSPGQGCVQCCNQVRPAMMGADCITAMSDEVDFTRGIRRNDRKCLSCCLADGHPYQRLRADCGV